MVYNKIHMLTRTETKQNKNRSPTSMAESVLLSFLFTMLKAERLNYKKQSKSLIRKRK